MDIWRSFAGGRILSFLQRGVGAGAPARVRGHGAAPRCQGLAGQTPAQLQGERRPEGLKGFSVRQVHGLSSVEGLGN